jgi:hypothetical protein
MSVTETAIASGVFEEQKYRYLFSLLNEWRDTVNAFNRRLDITELRTFINPSLEEIRSFYRGLQRVPLADKCLFSITPSSCTKSVYCLQKLL